jgi:hypothetical protein
VQLPFVDIRARQNRIKKQNVNLLKFAFQLMKIRLSDGKPMRLRRDDRALDILSPADATPRTVKLAVPNGHIGIPRFNAFFSAC